MYKPLSTYYQANVLKVCLYGLINGMGLLLSGNTLNFWLASFTIDIKIIGFFSLIALPHAFKYFIAIFIGRANIPILSAKLGTHKSWIIISQIILIFMLILMSFLNPTKNLILIAIVSFIISLSAVIQYVILNGNRIQILKSSEQGAGSAIYNIGYRLGMFITGAGVIYISSYMSWHNIYLTLAFIYFIIAIIVCCCYRDSNSFEQQKNQALLDNIFTDPIKHFLSYKNFIWIILFILLYQLSDSILMTMLNPFLLYKDYNAEEIASASKVCGIIMVIIGGFIGGLIVDKIGIRKSLLSFSFFHALGYIMFSFLAYMNKNVTILYFITGYVALTGGMTTTAYISFISGLSRGEHVTTLYALLSSVIGLAWIIFPSISGVIADYAGWSNFFIIITIIGFCTLMFTYMIPEKIYQIYKKSDGNKF